MQVKFLCTYWGREEQDADRFFDGVLAEGYDGVEVNLPEDPVFLRTFRARLVSIRRELPGFVFLAQQVLPPALETPAAYSDRMAHRLADIASMEPDAINAHTGKDHFSFEENCRIIETAEHFSVASRIPIYHETHRGRFTFHGASLLPYLQRFPGLRLTGDFSHWCTVSESALEDQEAVLEKIYPHLHHLHARVGSAQAPQVADPFAPEWESLLQHYLGWWRQALRSAELRGMPQLTITPEAGPAPYMPAMPYTKEPLAGQHDINLRMKNHLQINLATEHA